MTVELEHALGLCGSGRFYHCGDNSQNPNREVVIMSSMCGTAEVVAFALGGFSSMPAVQNFSICAALAVFLDFCLQVRLSLLACLCRPHARLWTFRKSPHAWHRPLDASVVSSQRQVLCLQGTPVHPLQRYSRQQQYGAHTTSSMSMRRMLCVQVLLILAMIIVSSERGSAMRSLRVLG